jgi:hypothetical protein
LSAPSPAQPAYLTAELSTLVIARHHPHIVQLLEWFEDSTSLFLVLVRGRGRGAAARACTRTGRFLRPFPPRLLARDRS